MLPAWRMKIVARGQQPHPLPRHPRADAQPREHAENQSGQKQERNEVEKKQGAVGSGEQQQRRGHPFDAAGAVVHPDIRRVNPPPLPVREPLQHALQPIIQPGVIGLADTWLRREKSAPPARQSRMATAGGNRRRNFSPARSSCCRNRIPILCGKRKGSRRKRRRKSRSRGDSTAPARTKSSPRQLQTRKSTARA